VLFKLMWVVFLMWMVVVISTVVSAAVANMPGMAKKMMPKMRKKMCESEMGEHDGRPLRVESISYPTIRRLLADRHSFLFPSLP